MIDPTVNRSAVVEVRGGGPINAGRWQVMRLKGGLSVILALLVLGLVLVLFRSDETVRLEEDNAEKEAQLDSIADPLAALCASDLVVRARVGDQVCFTAQVIAQTPLTVPPPGTAGAPGRSGRGIVASIIRNDGHLVVSFSDGAVVDAGPVVGRAGVDGRAVLRSQIVDGRLVLAFTDNTSEDLGPVVGERGAAGGGGAAGIIEPAGASGAPGRGVATTTIDNGRLVVTYTDGNTDDAGEVPPGPAGRDAERPTRYVQTFSDSTSQTCTRSGGDSSNPIYSCSERS